MFIQSEQFQSLELLVVWEVMEETVVMVVTAVRLVPEVLEERRVQRRLAVQEVHFMQEDLSATTSQLEFFQIHGQQAQW